MDAEYLEVKTVFLEAAVNSVNAREYFSQQWTLGSQDNIAFLYNIAAHSFK